MLLHWVKSFFKDELWVILHPEYMQIIRLSRSLSNHLKQQIIDTEFVEFSKNILETNKEFQEWAVLSECLKQRLKDARWKNVTPTVVVSNDFAHYAVIPWNAGLAIESEQKAFMQHCFGLAFGEVSKKLDLRMGIPDYGMSALASGVSVSLLNALGEAFSDSGNRLSAVYPQLMLVINQTINQLNNKNIPFKFWLVTIHAGRVCLALHLDSGWRLIRNLPAEVDISAQVASLIQRETVNGSVADELPVLLYIPESSEGQSLKIANKKVFKLLPHQFDIRNFQSIKNSVKWSTI